MQVTTCRAKRPRCCCNIQHVARLRSATGVDALLLDRPSEEGIVQHIAQGVVPVLLTWCKQGQVGRAPATCVAPCPCSKAWQSAAVLLCLRMENQVLVTSPSPDCALTALLETPAVHLATFSTTVCRSTSPPQQDIGLRRHEAGQPPLAGQVPGGSFLTLLQELRVHERAETGASRRRVPSW